MSKFFLAILITLNISTVFAADIPSNSYILNDGSYACLTANQGEIYSSVYQDYGHEEVAMYYTASSIGISCKRMENIEMLVGATALSIDGLAVIMACTGIGLPYAVKLQTAGFGLHVLEFIVGNLPCDNLTEDEQIQEKVNDTVCKVLRANDIKCDPNQLGNHSSSI